MKSNFFICSFCQMKIKAEQVPAGSQVRCPGCRQVFDPWENRAPAAATDTDQLIGQQLGNYRVLRRVGQGGMGTVYEAIQHGLERRVALKVLSAKLCHDKPFILRFKQEAKAAAALEHPGIVQVYEIAHDKGRLFFSMQYVDGVSLLERVRNGGHMKLADALDAMIMVVEGLSYAFDRGIIHRDIKPDNILLGNDGTVKVADLGLAKSLSDEIGLTATGAGLGSPHYMAPEQGKGEKNLGCQADIYSLGITLFVMVTGMRPFSGKSPLDIMLAHEKYAMPSACKLNPKLPQGFDKLVQKMCEKVPQRRHRTYSALLADIEALHPNRERRSAWAPFAVLKERAQRIPAWALAALLAIVMGATIGLARWSQNQHRDGWHSASAVAPAPHESESSDGAGNLPGDAVSPDELEDIRKIEITASDELPFELGESAEELSSPDPIPALPSAPVRREMPPPQVADTVSNPGINARAAGAYRPSIPQVPIVQPIDEPEQRKAEQVPTDAILLFKGKCFQFGRLVPRVGILEFEIQFGKKLPAQDYQILKVSDAGFKVGLQKNGILFVARTVKTERQLTLSSGTRKLADGKWHKVRLNYGAGTESLTIDGKARKVKGLPMLSSDTLGSLVCNPDRLEVQIALRNLHITHWFADQKKRLDSLLEQDCRLAYSQGCWMLEFAADEETRSYAASLKERAAKRLIELQGNQEESNRIRKQLKRFPGMVEVSSAFQSENAEHERLPTFFIDRHEVAISDYFKFWTQIQRTRDHSKCHPAEPKNKDHTPQSRIGPNSRGGRNLPVHGIDWFDAYAYAAWKGKRLPTLAEWRKAAGAQHGRQYPWGNNWIEGKVNPNRRPVTVSFYASGKSQYGCVQMSGNAEEWCADSKSGKYGAERALAGGSWRSGRFVKTTQARDRRMTEKGETFGFRCVKEPD
ncbi:MAG: protein kinase [Planctomycetota bacterium]|nr:protein kinase [Planctomycetota bacterium]